PLRGSGFGVVTAPDAAGDKYRVLSTRRPAIASAILWSPGRATVSPWITRTADALVRGPQVVRGPQGRGVRPGVLARRVVAGERGARRHGVRPRRGRPRAPGH